MCDMAHLPRYINEILALMFWENSINGPQASSTSNLVGCALEFSFSFQNIEIS